MLTGEQLQGPVGLIEIELAKGKALADVLIDLYEFENCRVEQQMADSLSISRTTLRAYMAIRGVKMRDVRLNLAQRQHPEASDTR